MSDIQARGKRLRGGIGILTVAVLTVAALSVFAISCTRGDETTTTSERRLDLNLQVVTINERSNGKIVTLSPGFVVVIELEGQRWLGRHWNVLPPDPKVVWMLPGPKVTEDGGRLQGLFTFTGWPTYTIICPDKSVKWDVNYPPNATGFNPYFAQCGTTGIQDLQKPDGLKIGKMYPVPAGDKLTVEVDVNRSTNIRIEIYNLLGLKVQSTDFEIGTAGNFELELNIAELKGGNYFLKLIESEQVRDIRKFNVMN